MKKCLVSILVLTYAMALFVPAVAFANPVMHTHSYSSSNLKSSSCTQEGLRMYQCACGDNYTEPIPALGHDYDNGAITRPPTNSSSGVKTYTCRRCGNQYTEVVMPSLDDNSLPMIGSGVRDSATAAVDEVSEDVESAITAAENTEVAAKEAVVSSESVEEPVMTELPQTSDTGFTGMVAVIACFSLAVFAATRFCGDKR